MAKGRNGTKSCGLPHNVFLKLICGTPRVLFCRLKMEGVHERDESCVNATHIGMGKRRLEIGPVSPDSSFCVVRQINKRSAANRFRQGDGSDRGR